MKIFKRKLKKYRATVSVPKVNRAGRVNIGCRHPTTYAYSKKDARAQIRVCLPDHLRFRYFTLKRA